MVKVARVSSKGDLKGTTNPKAWANYHLCGKSYSWLLVIVARAKVWLHSHKHGIIGKVHKKYFALVSADQMTTIVRIPSLTK